MQKTVYDIIATEQGLDALGHKMAAIMDYAIEHHHLFSDHKLRIMMNISQTVCISSFSRISLR